MDSNLIIIIIAVAASIISAIVKRRNKAKQQSTLENAPQEEPKGVLGKLQKALEENAKMVQEQQTKKIEQYEQMDGKGRKGTSTEHPIVFEPASPFDFSPSYKVATAPEEVEVMDESTAKRIETAKLRVSRISRVDNVIELDDDGELSDIMEDFDLRKAVIYSEILKSKF